MSTLSRIVKRFYSLEKEKLTDVILFGSSARGKTKPADVDVLLLFSSRVDVTVAYRLRKDLEAAGIPAQVISKTYRELFSSAFLARENILAEGMSIITGRTLAESFGYASYALIKYSLKGLNKSDRMRFYYALYGRGRSGVLKETGSVRFSESVLLVPTENSDSIMEFLGDWKIESRNSVVLLPAGNEKKLV